MERCEEWRSVDGGATWTNSRHITAGSKLSHNQVKTVFNHRPGDFRMMWSYGDSVFPPSTTDVFLYHYGDTLSKPAQMRFNTPPKRLETRQEERWVPCPPGAQRRLGMFFWSTGELSGRSHVHASVDMAPQTGVK